MGDVNDFINPEKVINIFANGVDYYFPKWGDFQTEIQYQGFDPIQFRADTQDLLEAAEVKDPAGELYRAAIIINERGTRIGKMRKRMSIKGMAAVDKTIGILKLDSPAGTSTKSSRTLQRFSAAHPEFISSALTVMIPKVPWITDDQEFNAFCHPSAASMIPKIMPNLAEAHFEWCQKFDSVINPVRPTDLATLKKFWTLSHESKIFTDDQRVEILLNLFKEDDEDGLVHRDNNLKEKEDAPTPRGKRPAPPAAGATAKKRRGK